ncbi:MAG: UDP-N-acetylenolpyruvoylglucosamine reductase [Micavibrio sp.]|nr:MAG: UDP-N-acetylenolpyruvoylglucosamine reductase [Micavibrio sp.]
MPDPAKIFQELIKTARGRLMQKASLGTESWFRCGGRCGLLFYPADLKDLKDFLEQYPKDWPLITLGGMANTIVRDGGVRGAVIRLGKGFADIEVEGTKITAGAGALNGNVAQAAAKAGIGGLEFLSGIPGTVGGAICMNAGAYGSEVKDVLLETTAINRVGQKRYLRPDHLQMSYRHTELPEDTILIEAVFAGEEEDSEIVRERLKDIKAKRQETQPITEKTGGSTFANPDGHKAWELIDKVGGRSLKVGGAQMSEKHCNFMINTGTATAADLEALGEEVRSLVREKTGIELQWEIKRIGNKLT